MANRERLRRGVPSRQRLLRRCQANRQQLGVPLPAFGLQPPIALGRLRLALEMRQLALQLLADVVQPRQIVLGVANAVLGFPPPLPVLGDARRFFEVGAQLLRLGFHQLGDHALLDDRVAARPEAGAEEHVRHVPPSTLGAVEEVGGDAIAPDFAANGDVRVGREIAPHAPVAVVEQQLDGRQRGRRPGARAVEDDVRQGLGPQLPRRALPHHPPHRVDDVGLATAVGADHRVAVARQNHRRRIDEGLEPRELDFLKSHVWTTVPLSLAECSATCAGCNRLFASPCRPPWLRLNVAWGQLRFGLPRVQRLNPCADEVAGVPAHDLEAMHPCRRRDQRVAFRAAIRNVKLGTPPGHGRINGQHPVSERWHNTRFKPGTQNHALGFIPPLHKQHPVFELQHGDCRDELRVRGYVAGPSDNVAIRLGRLPELRDDVGVQQVHVTTDRQADTSRCEGGEDRTRGRRLPASPANPRCSRPAP